MPYFGTRPPPTPLFPLKHTSPSIYLHNLTCGAPPQRRHDKHFCVHRTYLQKNRTQYAYGIYQGYVLETMLHEWLLSSPHRTLDPDQADWFYVPVYASCAIVTAIFKTPASTSLRYRLALAQRLYLRALAHVKGLYPFWNRSGGSDHIWTFGYDEGACFAPREIQKCMISPRLPPWLLTNLQLTPYITALQSHA
ncbi:MAG: hypothetical protein SGPRY_005482 [Prymnesium sp.]